MAAAMRKTEHGLEFTTKALAIVVACLTIGGAVVGVAAAWATTNAQVDRKVDKEAYLADQSRIRARLDRDSARLEQINGVLGEVLDRTRRIDERQGQMWCEQHFTVPPKSCQ